MNFRNLYFFLIGILLVGASSCSKPATTKPNTGNVPVNPAGKPVPAGYGDGVTFFNNGTSAMFNLYAPSKTSVSLIGDFNNWTASSKYTMTNTPDGTRWWLEVDGLNPATEYGYQYLIDGSVKVADPYSNKILDPANDPGIPASVYPNLKAYPTGLTTGYVSDIQYNAPAYSWKVSNFTPPAPKNLVIYEILVRDFVATHSYQTLTDTLNYMARLGVNAIELMPVNEFEGNDSWGYNPDFMMALDKYYGTENAYKAFIDACHARGIAVIQDIVLEDQFGSSPMVQMYWNSSASQPAANSPWFDQTNMYPNAVGYQLNHESAATVYYTENVMKYWIQQYHIDGYRFDSGQAFTQTNSGSSVSAQQAYDGSRVAIWAKYISYMQSIKPNILITGEYWTVDQEQLAVAKLGYMMWNNLSTQAEQATMGWPTTPVWDISALFYDQFSFPSSQPYSIISYFESHDQERLQYQNETYGNSSGSYNTQTIATGLQRDQMGAVFMFSSPGPKMVWQFGELGYDISINYNGRLGDKPILWNYDTQPTRQQLFATYAQMIKWKVNNSAFTTTSFTYNLGGAVKFIQLLDPNNTNNVEVVGNFAVTSQPAVITFPSTGTWYDNITGTSISVTTQPYQYIMAPGEYHLYSNKPLTN